MEKRPSHRPSIPSKSEVRRYENGQWHITERTIAVTPDGVIGVSVTAVVAAPITIAISRVAIAVTGIGRGIITIAVSRGTFLNCE